MPKLKTGKEVYPSWIDLFNYLKFIINDDKADEEAIRSDCFNIERLKQHGESLAKAQLVTNNPNKGYNLSRRLLDNKTVLYENYNHINEAIKQEQAITPAAEWLIDNFHIIEEQLKDIQIHLPIGFYKELPKLSNSSHLKGYPRVYGLAWNFIAHLDSRFEPESLIEFSNAYQSIQALSIGEIWAIAISLRTVLIENLRRLSVLIVNSSQARKAADMIADALLSGKREEIEKAENFLGTIASEPLRDSFLVQLLQRLHYQDPAVTPALKQINQRLIDLNITIDELVSREHNRQSASNLSVRNIITSMRAISTFNWRDFFEAVSITNKILSKDSSFTVIDFATQDQYLHAIEALARNSKHTEISIAKRIISKIETLKLLDSSSERELDIGFYLISRGKKTIEKEISFKAPIFEKLKKIYISNAKVGYSCTILLFSGLIVFFSALINEENTVPIWALWAFAITSFFPASDIVITLVNKIVSMTVGPQHLPLIKFDSGVPPSLSTFVVMPILLINTKTIEEQLQQLEIHYLSNPEGQVHFAILSDWKDSNYKINAADCDLLKIAKIGIENLNKQYGSLADEQKRFFIFHRKQIWNTGEGKWMGWERKRVKLHEFNQLLRGSEDTTYIVTKEELAEIPRNIKYVITLDADTRMPMQSVEQLVGTIAHPLNKAHLNEELRIVTEGYGILRPCVLASLPTRHNTSIFQRLFSGPCGMDPYTFTSSDVYQDLFGEASYTGKGIYDLDIFEAVLKDRIPENSLLSHDLLEGIFARCGFISDLNLFEDFPSNTEVAASRLHRWTRGDWQLLPWIFDNKDKTIPFIGLWKMLDNLRRSLSTPAMILILALAWFIPQAPHLYWILFIITAIALPLFLPFISGFFAYPFRNQLNRTRADLHYEFLLSLGQTLCTIALLLHSALQMIDAITRTLFRLFISKRKLLQWVSASQEQISSNLSPLYFFKKHRVSVIIAAYTGILIIVSNTDLLTKALASPFIIAWILSPVIAYFISLPPKADPTESLAQDESKKLRLIARHTWRFFTTFVTKEDNFLPPDNFQETPSPTIAHRSSPTNFGLYLLSILAAKDFGWIGKKEMLNKLEQTLEVLEELPRHRGHFFNWYETTSKQPLHPHYISSVDSGNLAAYLLVVAQACEELEETAFSIENRVAGIQDAIELLKESLAKLRDKRRTSIVDLDQLKSSIKHLEKLLIDILFCDHENAEIGVPQRSLAAEWQLIQSMAHTLMDISETLIQELGKTDTVEILFWTREVYETIKSHIADSQETSNDLKTLSEKTINIINSAQKLFTEMDFKFLFDDHRKLFYIGFNASENIFDNSFYDMLASEARLTSFVTIAKGEVSVKHWFLLSRALTAIGHTAALLSWSGSIFEYLMPSLVMYTPSKSLLDNTCRSIIKRQIEYGKEQDVPWGISESAYNIRDINLTYQYSSFGVPGLGLKRGIGQNLVISPYSTALAAMYYPKLALENFEALVKLDALGKYGFYEAIDFTASRIPENKKLAIVQNYMAHHQGMSIIALGNVIFKGNMRHRFHNIPEIRAAELLLQERTPHTITTIEPFVDQIEIDNVRNLAQPLIRRFKLPSHSIPETHLLSNGHYSVMFNSAGSGYSKWKDIAVTRWREDATCDRHGSYIFLRDIDTKQSWSLGYQPSATKPSNYEANFTEDMARIFREDGDITSYLELIVSNEDDTEIKRITIKNNGLRTKEIEITSYSEIVLAPQATDLMHPAFSNLFIETEYLAKTNTLIASRRPRSSKEKAVWLAHLIAIENNTKSSVVEYETDRSRFLGRTRSIRNAISITEGQALSNTVGAVLDPIVSLRTRIIIPAGASLGVCFATMVSDSREELITRIDKYCDTSIFERAAALAWTHSQAKLHYLGIDESEANLFQQMASHLIYVNSAMRPSSNLLKRNTLNVSGLWTHKISGDHPILLACINSVDDQPLVKQLLRAHEYWRLKRFAVDLIFINEKNTSYVQDLQVLLESMIRTNMKASDEDNHILNYGSVYAIRADLLNPAEQNLFNTVARMIISSEEGTLSEQLRRINLGSHKLIHESKIHTNINTQRNWSLNAPPLEYFNGLGGFTDDGKEYAIVLNKLQSTPAPWINIIANDQIGFLVSESGSSYTWSLNSRENQITAWSNDAVSDPSGEAFYIVDEDTQEIWTPTALPIRIENATYITRHGQGYSSFEHFSHDIESKLTQYVSNSASIKISRLVLKNHSPKSRNLSITAYVEWVLGSSRSNNAPFIITEVDEDTGAIFVYNPWNRDFSERISFTDFYGMKTSHTTDRKEFIGRNGTLSKPAALSKGQHLSGSYGAGLDPCSAQSQRIELEANQSIELVFFLGQADNKDDASKLITEYRNTDLDYILNDVKQNWDKILGKIQVKTPDRASDLMLNGWLLYQSLSCRYLARTAFYQASGAFGFRDQLQDVMALTISRPDITKAQILNAARHQFLAGDVQHWWHPPSDKGVRTKCSDDLVWLPYAVHHYIKTTGDSSILEEEIPFLEGPELSSLDESIYFEPIHLKQTASLFEHCKKALDKSLRTGSHGLPLIGSCDWSDGLNMVGEKGLGESVWLGWFLYLNLINFSTLIKDLNINYDTSTWLRHAKFLQESLESAWDGEWYTRAFFDDGTPLGSKLNDECKIDCLAQSWSVISKAADKSRASLAMDSVEKYLIKHTDKMMLLFTPPFNKTVLDPGYIKGYLPGIRENGGQYTHGVVWNIIAYAMLGNAKKAHECFSMLNPINHSNTRLGAHKYKLEPYVMAGDVYSEAPHTGRGGWSWYTGSAAWMYRAGIEWILGLTVENSILKLNPCIPDYWDGFTIYYQHESTSYEITVKNKQTSLKHMQETDTQNTVSSPKKTIELDGEIILGNGIPLVNDGIKHFVKLELSTNFN